MEIEIAARRCKDGLGQAHRFRYYLTVDLVETERVCWEDYGVRIAEDQGESAVIPSITTSAARIDELMTLLVDHRVGPAGLADVVADWL